MGSSEAIGMIYGQEKNITAYNLARMNMLLHGLSPSQFEIFHGDTLINEWEMFNTINPITKPQFDAIVANPPFSYKWDRQDELDDFRFNNYGLAPRSAADFAFYYTAYTSLKMMELWQLLCRMEYYFVVVQKVKSARSY